MAGCAIRDVDLLHPLPYSFEHISEQFSDKRTTNSEEVLGLMATSSADVGWKDGKPRSMSEFMPRECFMRKNSIAEHSRFLMSGNPITGM